MELRYRHSPSLLLFLLHLILFLRFSISIAQAQASTKYRAMPNNRISAILVFGDSTVDPGNNNFINTAFRGNFPPYGKDFKDQVPTGRFTNGRLSTDFIASYAGVKDYVPPYLDPTLSIEDLMTGVSFASAGSGFDPLTPIISNVMDISTQLVCFKEYKRRIEAAIGKQKMENHIKKAFFMVSAGTNDFVVNYFTVPIRRKSFTVSDYQKFVIQNVKQLIQGLWDEGARYIGVVGLPPMGCLPIVITLNSKDAIQQRSCIENYSSVARDFNVMLQNELNFMQINLTHLYSRIDYIDIFNGLNDMIEGYSKFGFDEVSSGCCGSGFLEAGFLCNPKSFLCPDASKYVFFDSIHPTEKTYYNLFQASRSIIDTLIARG